MKSKWVRSLPSAIIGAPWSLQSVCRDRIEIATDTTRVKRKVPQMFSGSFVLIHKIMTLVQGGDARSVGAGDGQADHDGGRPPPPEASRAVRGAQGASGRTA